MVKRKGDVWRYTLKRLSRAINPPDDTLSVDEQLENIKLDKEMLTDKSIEDVEYDEAFIDDRGIPHVYMCMVLQGLVDRPIFFIKIR